MMLTTRCLTATYGVAPVIHDVEIAVKEGGITALLGANGAGKTTTLRSISNILVRRAGEVRFFGKRIDGLAADEIVKEGIAHVPDGRGTFSDFTVEENLRIGAYAIRGGAKARDLERTYDRFPRLLERRKQQAGTLSGGEQQMLAISRALMARPKLLLLDEPSFGLAPTIVADIFKMLKEINKQEKMGILLVEQNAVLALETADMVYLMETGKIIKEGPPEELRGDEVIRRSYLGV